MAEIIYTDIAVVGGGASGLAAAISAGQSSEGKLKITVIEALPRVGKKILATGNGRCNLSNTNINAENYHGDLALFKSVAHKFGKAEDFFKSLGVICKADDEGRLYPYSNHAAAVLDALRLEEKRLEIIELCDFKVAEIKHKSASYELISTKGKVIAKTVILALGGYSAPALGTDGDGARLAKSLGHKVLSPIPSLCPVKTTQNATKGLKGIRVNCVVTAELAGKALKSEVGEVQFADGLLSGICIFNMSRFAGEFTDKVTIVLDLMPEYEIIPLKNLLFEIRNQRENQPLEDMLTGIFQKRIGVALLKSVCEKALTEKTGCLSDKEIDLLARKIKRWEFPVTAQSGFNTSQVTAGGVSAKELDENLQSKLHKGLYFAGELVNIDGDCGGYNLYWAWASGSVTGKNAVKSVKELL